MLSAFFRPLPAVTMMSAYDRFTVLRFASGMNASSLVTMSVSIMPSAIVEIVPVRLSSRRGIGAVRGRIVAICGR